MDYVVVSGVPPYDGRYPFDLENSGFTTQEWGWIKRLAGYLPLTIDEGWAGGDAELFTVFALIALVRAGKAADSEAADVFGKLQRAPFDTTIRLESDRVEEEGDAGPPPESSNSNGATSGAASTTNSENQAEPPPATGIPASVTSASAPATSKS
jgi:hypothetical protein